MKTPWRIWYNFRNRNWWQVDFVLWLIIVALFVYIFTGCTQTRSTEQTQTEKTDTVTITGTVPMAGPEGVIQVPIALTIDRTGTEQADRQTESKTGIDGAAVGREIAAALAPIISAAVTPPGIPWPQILNGVGTAAVAATTGYLALKKREQLRPERSHRNTPKDTP